MRPFILAPLIAVASPVHSEAPVAESVEMHKLLDLLLAGNIWNRLVSVGFGSWFDDSVSDDARLMKLFGEHPGLRKRVEEALRADVSARLQERIPSIRADFEYIFREELTPSQVKALSAFVASPVCREIIELALDDVIEGNDSDFTESEDFNSKIMPKILASPEDLKVFTAFEQSGIMAKFDVLGPRLEAVFEPWAAQFHADNQARLRDVAKATTTAYIAEQQAKAQLR